MSAEDAVASGRLAAERRMKSRATVRRKTGAMTTAANGRQVPEWTIVHTDLPVRVAGSARRPAPHRTTTIAGGEVNVSLRDLEFPAATTDLIDGDLVDITAGDTAGSVFRIGEADWQDQATARRVPAIAAERPQEW